MAPALAEFVRVTSGFTLCGFAAGLWRAPSSAARALRLLSLAAGVSALLGIGGALPALGAFAGSFVRCASHAVSCTFGERFESRPVGRPAAPVGPLMLAQSGIVLFLVTGWAASQHAAATIPFRTEYRLGLTELLVIASSLSAAAFLGTLGSLQRIFSGPPSSSAHVGAALEALLGGGGS